MKILRLAFLLPGMLIFFAGCYPDKKEAKRGNERAEDIPITDSARVAQQMSIDTSNYKAAPIEWELVEGGSFNMGSDSGNFDEKPVHKVTLKSFYISKYEITQAQWKAVMINESHFKCDSCPAENVMWDKAFEFILKLNAKGNKYRFPTEAEWEYAARGGNKTHGYMYSGSNNINDVAWCATNSTHPVGAKQPNELGIYDMSGNVAEYCSDWYNEAYYAHSATQNPTGPAVADEIPSKIVRGGSWGADKEYCTVSRRFTLETFEALNGVGIRLVKDVK